MSTTNVITLFANSKEQFIFFNLFKDHSEFILSMTSKLRRNVLRRMHSHFIRNYINFKCCCT